VDPIHPITPGLPGVSRAGRVPVERLERISRERDRPSGDPRKRRRPDPLKDPESDRSEEDGPGPRIDVRA
jgi:hypothetical protein